MYSIKAHKAFSFSWLLPRIIIIIFPCLCMTSCPFPELSCTALWYWIMYEVREIYNAETVDPSLDFIVKNGRVHLIFLCLTLSYQRYSLCHLVERISCSFIVMIIGLMMSKTIPEAHRYLSSSLRMDNMCPPSEELIYSLVFMSPA